MPCAWTLRRFEQAPPLAENPALLGNGATIQDDSATAELPVLLVNKKKRKKSVLQVSIVLFIVVYWLEWRTSWSEPLDLLTAFH